MLHAIHYPPYQPPIESIGNWYECTTRARNLQWPIQNNKITKCCRHIEHRANSEDNATKNLLKWKGVVFETDEDDRMPATTMSSVQTPETTTTTSSEPDASWATMIEVKAIATDPTVAANSNATIDETTQKVIILLHLSPAHVLLRHF